MAKDSAGSVNEDTTLKLAYERNNYDECIAILMRRLSKYQASANPVKAFLADPGRALSAPLVNSVLGPLLGNPLLAALSNEAETLTQLGEAYFLKGDYARAESFYFQSMAVQEAVNRMVYDRDLHPKVNRVGSVAECLQRFDSIKRITVDRSGKDSCYMSVAQAAETLLALGIVEMLNGKFQDGQRLYGTALPYVAFGLGSISVLEKTAAEQRLNELAEKTEKSFGRTNSYFASAKEMLATFDATQDCIRRRSGGMDREEMLQLSMPSFVRRASLYSEAIAIREESNDVDEIPMLIIDLQNLRTCLDWQLQRRDGDPSQRRAEARAVRTKLAEVRLKWPRFFDASGRTCLR